MKKFIVLIAIIAIVATAIFAADPVTPAVIKTSTNDSNVTSFDGTASSVIVKTTIGPKGSATWRISKIATVPAAYADLVTDVTDSSFVFSDSDTGISYTAYPTILTNMETQARATITASPLTKATGPDATTNLYDADDCIAYSVTLNGTKTDITTAPSNDIGSFETTGNKLRLKDATVVFATTRAALQAAEAGSYAATVTMTVATI